MILILAILLLITTVFSYYVFDKDFLSITTISSAMFFVFSLMYVAFYPKIGSDISFSTVVVIVGSILFTFIGEFLGRSTNTGKLSTEIDKKYEISYSNNVMYIWFAFMLALAAYRYYDLYRFSLTIGNTNGLLGTLSSVRLAVATGKYVSDNMNIFIFLATAVCEVVCYISIYLFIYEIIEKKSFRKHLLLPIIGYCCILVSFTGRTEYLKLFVAVLVSYVSIHVTKYGQVASNKAFKTLIKLAAVMVVLFFWYGSFTRSGGSSEYVGGIVNNIIAYSAAAIIGLNTCMDKGLGGIVSPYFGYWTLQSIYDFFGVVHNYAPPMNLTMFHYGANNEFNSNIYTSLAMATQDFGIAGLFIIKMICGVLSSKLVTVFKKLSLDNVGIKTILLLIVSNIIYCYFLAPVSDKFVDLLSISTWFKYTIFAYCVIVFLSPYKIKAIRGEDVESKQTGIQV